MQVLVARIGKPHGIRGEVTVQLYTDTPEERFAVGERLSIENFTAKSPAAAIAPAGELTVAASRWNKKILVVRFEEISNRNQAEELRDTRLMYDVPESNDSFATTEKGYTLANGTQVPERTEWHNIVVWRGFADVVEKYVHKGDKLYLEGKVRTRSYDDSRGVKRYTTEVFIEYMEMLSSKPHQAPPPPPLPEQTTHQSEGNECPPPPTPTLYDLPF